jgi:hypothetical protein
LTLFATRGDQVLDDNDKPVGKQPTGGYVEVMEEFDPNRVFNENKITVDPTYIFRLDDDEISPEVDLINFRMYDGNTDITFDTMLIIKASNYSEFNVGKYIAQQVGDTIRWIELR